MLTGLEQYSLERAGYFIRRADIPPADLAKGAAEILHRVAHTAVSALGNGPIKTHLGRVTAAGRWTRGFPIAWDLCASEQIAGLARTMEHLQLRVAIEPEDSLLLLPGTHAAPPAPEDLAQLSTSPSGDTPGMVRARLAPGDVLYWNTNVIHRATPESDNTGSFCATFVSQSCPVPDWAGLPLVPMATGAQYMDLEVILRGKL